MERNISTMADFFRDKTTRLRAHSKVHRVPIIAHKQLQSGAKGLCCQKVAEAEVMVAAGIRDIIVTNEIVTPAKIKRLVALARQAKIGVPIDSLSNAESLSSAAQREGVELNTLVDVHLGSNRCGVEPGEPAVKLAMAVKSLRGLNFVGLMGFEGHLSWIEPREKRRIEIEKCENLLINSKKLIENAGIRVEEISTGSTGTYDVSGTTPEITEVQAGTYVLMDSEYHKHVREFSCALTVLSTVVSKPSDRRIVTDAGLMSISVAVGKPEIIGVENLEVEELHAENTVLRVKGPSKTRVEDKIEFIPSYLDGTVNYHSKIYGVRKEHVETIWNTLGRGASN
jgi:D-serine deaminase-like pyridoxal phosphate-dependent protein